jgi:hypothetical protein
MRFCSANCFLLVWNSNHYDAYTENRDVNIIASTYFLISFKRESVILDRRDGEGRSRVTGQISDQGDSMVHGRIEWLNRYGNKTFACQLTWGDALNRARNVPPVPLGPASAHTAGPPNPRTPSAAALPTSLRFCDVNCVTLELQGGDYVDINGNEIWTVDNFTKQSATFHRNVQNPAFSITYQGRVSVDGNSLAGVPNPFCCNGGQPANITLAWGTALSSVSISTEDQQAQRTQICKSPRIRGAMQLVEEAAIKDPIVAPIAQLFGNAGTAQILDSKDGTDGGRYTSKDPGSFVCRGLFLHQDLKIDTTDRADPAAQVAAETVQEIMSKYPTFVEWFKVKRMGSGTYRLTLLPSSIELSREYARDFVYP